MLKGLLEFCPQLAKWFVWSYGVESPLFNSDRQRVGTSKTGCRQGDPLAVLCFCVGFHYVLRSISEMIENVAALSPNAIHYSLWAYIDDLNIGVPVAIANAVSERLADIFGENYRIFINPEKTKLVGKAALQVLNPLFEVVPYGQLIVGVPTGEEDYCKDITMQKIQQAISSLPSLQHISPWSAWLLLRYCIIARIGYLARALEPKISLDAFKWFDEKVDEALLAKIGEDVSHHTNDFHGSLVMALRSQPLAQGGLGLQRYSGLAGEVACVQSRGVLAHFIIERMPHLISPVFQEWIPIFLGAQEEPHLQDVGIPYLTSQSRTAGPLSSIIPEDIFSELSASLQETVSEAKDARIAAHAIYTRRSADLVTMLQSMNRPALVQWLQSSRFKGSGRWLAGNGGSIFYGPFSFKSSQEYTVALRLRLLLPPTSSSALGGAIACSCGEIYLHDDLPFHYMDCIKLPKLHKQRHNLIRDTLCSFLRSTDKTCRVSTEALIERPGINNQSITTHSHQNNAAVIPSTNALINANNEDNHHNNNNNNNLICRRIDIAAIGINKVQYIDITVVNSSAKSYLEGGQQQHNGSDATNLSVQDVSYAVKVREKQKREGLRGILGEGVERLEKFVAFVIEITGKLGPASRSLLDAADLSGWSSGIYIAQVGSLVARYNATIFSQWLSAKCA
jgi:hypothetical protein